MDLGLERPVPRKAAAVGRAGRGPLGLLLLGPGAGHGLFPEAAAAGLPRPVDAASSSSAERASTEGANSSERIITVLSPHMRSLLEPEESTPPSATDPCPPRALSPSQRPWEIARARLAAQGAGAGGSVRASRDGEGRGGVDEGDAGGMRDRGV